jgi:hypothetical protein
MDVPHRDGFTPLHRTVWGRQPRHMETARVLVKEGGANVDGRGLHLSNSQLNLSRV